MRRCKTIDLLECGRGRERLKKSWNDVLKYDLNFYRTNKAHNSGQKLVEIYD